MTTAMVELMAAVVALDHLGPRIRKRYVVLLIDSEAVEAGLIKGYSQEEDMSDFIAVFWDIVLSFDLHLYICKVPTDANPSDGASRGDFDELEGGGAKWVNSNPSDVVTCPWFGGPRLRSWPESTHQASGLEWTVSYDCDIDGTVSSAHHLFNFIDFFLSLPLPSLLIVIVV